MSSSRQSRDRRFRERLRLQRSRDQSTTALAIASTADAGEDQVACTRTGAETGGQAEANREPGQEPPQSAACGAGCPVQLQQREKKWLRQLKELKRNFTVTDGCLKVWADGNTSQVPLDELASRYCTLQ